MSQEVQRELVKYDSRSGRPSTSRTKVNVKRVRQVECDDRRLTVRMIASQLDKKKNKVYTIITEDLIMWKVFAKIAPKLLNDDSKEYYMQTCHDIIKCLQTEPGSLRWVFTSDKAWNFEYDPETKYQIGCLLACLVGFWHINFLRLFDTRSCLYIYGYMIWEQTVRC